MQLVALSRFSVLRHAEENTKSALKTSNSRAMNPLAFHWPRRRFLSRVSSGRSDCVRCIDCRKTQQDRVELRSKYEYLLQKHDRTDAETLELANCALNLIECGLFGNRTIERVRCFLNSIQNDSDLRTRGQYRDLEDRVALLAEKSG